MTLAGAERLLKREDWAKRVRILISKHSREEAARLLGVSGRQLRRYCQELGLGDGRLAKGAASDTDVSIPAATRGR